MVLNVSHADCECFYHYGTISLHKLNALARPHVSRRDFLGINQVGLYCLPRDMFGDNMMESKLEAVMALTALLQGPFEEGNRVLGKEGVLEIILAMADSNDAIHTVGHSVHPQKKQQK